jgi:hypothetical protein
VVVFVADDGPRRPVQAREDREACATEDGVDGGRCELQFVGNSMWASSQLSPQRADRFDDRLAKRMGQSPGSTGTLPETGKPFLPIPLPPLGDRTARNALGFRYFCLGPALLETANKEHASVLVELRVSIGHRGTSVVWSVTTQTNGRSLSQSNHLPKLMTTSCP